MAIKINYLNNLFSFSVLLIFLMIFPLSYSQAQSTPIECIIVETTGCPTCHNNYLTLIKPFWDAYRDNDAITFQLIDVANPDGSDLFLNETNRLKINRSEQGLLPWVIFTWNDSQNVIVLDISELEFVEETFLTIIDSLNVAVISNTKNNSSSSVAEILFSFLPNVVIITIYGAIFGGFSLILYKYFRKTR